jgi:hypothetical protein
MLPLFASATGLLLGAPLMDEPQSIFDKLKTAALILAGLILLIPLMLLFAIGLYVTAVFQAVRLLLGGRRTPPAQEPDPLPRPHRWETRAETTVPKSGDERSESSGSTPS